MKSSQFLPILDWGRRYGRGLFISDLIAAVIVTVMLIPQSLAYALLAGLPAQVGLYASILPLAAYALFGTSRTLSVGPVAVIALMTASAIQGLGLVSPEAKLAAAIVLAVLSGLMLLALGILRFGFLANFLSHPVVSGFISASGILIALSQVKHILGISTEGDTLPELLHSLFSHLSELNLPTVVLGSLSLAFLFWSRKGVKSLLTGIGVPVQLATIIGRTAPVLVVITTIAAAKTLHLDERGVLLVGEIPAGLPRLVMPSGDLRTWSGLVLSAALIAIIGYVESVSVGKTLAARRRQKINPDQELIGLGMASIASGLSGGFPVTGGFSRSVVNFDAGAQTQAASIMTAIGIAVATLTLTGVLAWLPRAALAATIIVAVLSLVDLGILRKTWQYSRNDFIAIFMTITITLVAGVEMGVLCGVISSIVLHLMKTTRPHIAVVGEVEGTEHFRNVERYKVITHPWLLSLRMDESLYFANAAYLEDEVLKQLAERPDLRHVVLMCSAVNEIDISALEVLESINHQLASLQIGFHLSEVKGPVMDMLSRSDFLDTLNGNVYMSQHQAVEALRKQEMQVSRASPDFRDFQI